MFSKGLLNYSLVWRPNGPGGESGVVPPVPIPNTAVKRSSAHDTGVIKPRENRPVPGPFGRYTSFLSSFSCTVAGGHGFNRARRFARDRLHHRRRRALQPFRPRLLHLGRRRTGPRDLGHLPTLVRRRRRLDPGRTRLRVASLEPAPGRKHHGLTSWRSGFWCARPRGVGTRGR